MLSHDKFVAKLLSDPEVKAEYDAMEDEFALFDEFLHGPGDILHRLIKALLADIAHENLNTGLGADLSDPVSHGPGSDNKYLLDIHDSSRQKKSA